MAPCTYMRLIIYMLEFQRTSRTFTNCIKTAEVNLCVKEEDILWLCYRRCERSGYLPKTPPWSICLVPILREIGCSTIFFLYTEKYQASDQDQVLIRDRGGQLPICGRVNGGEPANPFLLVSATE